MKAIDRDILNIALPAIVSNITVPLLGLVDVTIVGHIGGASTIGAIAVGSMVFNVIYWIFGFLRMGTSGITAQAFGRHDTAGISGTLFRSLSVGLLTGVAFVCLQSLLWQCAVFLIRPTADIVAPASRYFDICIWGAPATLGLYSLTGWYIGMQDTKTPMVISIMQHVLNIACSLFFVFVLGKGIEGVAFGTLTAQYAGLFTALVMLRRYPRHVGACRRADFLDMPALLRFFTVNRDIFLRTLFLVAVNLFFTSAGARQGAVILSVNTLLFQLFTLYSYVMDGFAYAGEALGGRHYGARDKARFSLSVRRLFGWSLLLTAAYTIVYYNGGTHLSAMGMGYPDSRHGGVLLGRAVYRHDGVARNAGIDILRGGGVFRHMASAAAVARQPRPMARAAAISRHARHSADTPVQEIRPEMRCGRRYDTHHPVTALPENVS